ncbi:MAG: ABC transporter ATP-binding protein [Opitutaceae bacterium]|nr:ABC transporter ATP-binding protein [Opitutaceae bacterium]
MSSVLPLPVCIRALVKRYGPTLAVDGLDLEVAPGEIVGLLGPNGAGKTTTLECLLGLRPPDSGELRLGGLDVRTRLTEALRCVGAQIQPAALQGKITPREALTFFASFYSFPADTENLLARFALAEKADAPFDSLSSGQRQRLSVALAFVNRPALLVLDEPTTGLDPHARRELHRILTEHRSGGGAVLLSTHDLDEAQRLCDRVAILHRGHLIATATPEALIARTGAATRIVFQTARPLEAKLLATLPTLLDVALTTVPEKPARTGTEASPPQHELRTTAPARTIGTLTAWLQAEHHELSTLQLLPPTLEDAFVALTGEGWDGATEASL